MSETLSTQDLTLEAAARTFFEHEINFRYRPYTNYKPSGVEWLGNIPALWQVKKLKYITQFAYGDSLPSENRKEGLVPVYGSNGIISSHNTSNTKAPAIIVGRKGSFGKINYAKEPCFAIDTTFFIDKNLTKEHLRWLFYALSLLGLDTNSQDSAIPGLSREFAYELSLVCPPLDEQQAIADFLDKETAKIDTLVAKKERLVELLQEKRTALISQAVTRGLDASVPFKPSGVDWLGDIPAHWKLTKVKYLVLSKLGAIKTGPFGSQLLSSEMTAGDIKVYNQKNVIESDLHTGENYISAEKFQELKSFEVFPEDILITTRGTIGRCLVLPSNIEKGILHPCLLRVQVNNKKILAKFFKTLIQDSLLLNSQLFLASNSTTIEVIYSDTIKQLQLPLPSFDEQKAIADFLDRETAKIDALVEKVQQGIERLKEYRVALISAAVTGKIDVRNVES